ncbi:hypothetical protein [Actinobacillus equuli]|uniref:hypothetical protein n=1 Tax=Actinobacillus equuli TaxID=718 RepID=UPI0012DFEE46|nr:hypothetical protein [Actinobacillus equuli]MDG4951975.1 hypothetical protein [Actinobacillus equuli subsp. equuli]WGE57554.1 hypothetical protein NYR71_02005 [Actinobacillus equuli subsp. equuli]
MSVWGFNSVTASLLGLLRAEDLGIENDYLKDFEEKWNSTDTNPSLPKIVNPK